MSYIFDSSGRLADNRVSGEVIHVDTVNGGSSGICIPAFAPFYQENFIVKEVLGDGSYRLMVEDVDFIYLYPYYDATQMLGKYVVGGFYVLPTGITSVNIDYNTIGGSWIHDPIAVRDNIARNTVNPRIVLWDSITNVQQLFPPLDHLLHTDDLLPSSRLIEAISDIGKELTLNGLMSVRVTALEISNTMLLNALAELTSKIELLEREVANMKSFI
jgi:hypothetical protein